MLPTRACRCALLALALAQAACGYQLVQQGQVPGGRPLRVAAFVNRTAQAEAGGLFAAAAREQLGARGQLAPEDAAAAPVLEGELLSSHVYVIGVGTAGAQAFRVDGQVRLKIHAGPTPLFEDVTGGSEDYLQGVDVLSTEANRRAALRRLADSLVRAALEKMQAASLFAR